MNRHAFPAAMAAVAATAIALTALWPYPGRGQSLPNGTITPGLVWTSGQWIAAWMSKQDFPASAGIPLFSWNSATRPASPTPGLFGYNTTLSSTEFWNGSTWVQGSGGGAAVALGTAVGATNPSRTGTVNTGLYSPAANTVGIATNGASRLTVDGTGAFALTGASLKFNAKNVAAITGTPTATHCAAFDSTSSLVDAGATCGGGAGGGNVSGPGSSVAGSVPFWNNTIGTLLSDPGAAAIDGSNNFTTGKGLYADTTSAISLSLPAGGFNGGLNVNTSLGVASTTHSELVWETGAAINLISQTGATHEDACHAGTDPLFGCFKVALFAGIEAKAGTGSVWALNTVLTMDAGSGTNYDAQGYELDFNNNNVDRGNTDSATGFFTRPVANGLAIGNISTHRSSAAISVSGLNGATATSPVWNRGLAISGYIGLQDVVSYSVGPVMLSDQGFHGYGIDLSRGSYNATFFASGTTPTGALASALHLGNGANSGISFRNAAGNADRSVMYLDSTNNVVLGDSGTTSVALATNLIPVASNVYVLGNTTADQWLRIYGQSIFQNGNQVAGIIGTPTANNCVKWASSTTVTDSGGTCGGGGGGGNVNGPGSSSVGHFATFNNTAGTLLSDSGLSSGSFVAASGGQLVSGQLTNGTTVNGGGVWALDLVNSVASAGGIHLPNQNSSSAGVIFGRNASNTGDISMMYIGASNIMAIGAGGGEILSMLSTLIGMPNIPSGAGTSALCWNSTGGSITWGSGGCTVSSRRFKEREAPLTSGLAEVMALKPTSYFYRAEHRGKDHNLAGQQVGLIAEEVALTDGRLVTRDDEGLPYQVRYENLTAVLVKAIQEMETERRKMAAEIRALRAANDNRGGARRSGTGG